MADFRASFRYQTLRSARIVLNDGGIIDCVVRDVSTKGARLEIAEATKIPEQFTLLIRGQGERFRCHRVWQKGNMVGVEYY
jgi:PilZ domain